MDTIQKNAVATIDYALLTLDGEVIDQGNQMAYLHGHNNLLSGMELALEGKNPGQEIEHQIAPEDAFGAYIDEKEPIRIHRKHFGKDFEKLEQGIVIPITDSEGNETILYVVQRQGSYATLTRNHPLAGVSLMFNAKVLNVRCALPEEINNKMAFGKDGDRPPSSCACC